MFVGLIFIGIGLFKAIPMAGWFGIFWTVVAIGITIYHALNVFTDRGVAESVIDVESTLLPDEEEEAAEERLTTLANLRQKGLISDTEYDQQRQRILGEI